LEFLILKNISVTALTLFQLFSADLLNYSKLPDSNGQHSAGGLVIFQDRMTAIAGSCDTSIEVMVGNIWDDKIIPKVPTFSLEDAPPI